MRYECNNHLVEAQSLEEAKLIALTNFGVEVIGSCIKCLDNNDMCFGVCLDTYKGRFASAGFTEEDFLMYEIALCTLHLYGEKTEHYDCYDDCTYYIYNQDAIALFHKMSRLARYMKANNLSW